MFIQWLKKILKTHTELISKCVYITSVFHATQHNHAREGVVKPLTCARVTPRATPWVTAAMTLSSIVSRCRRTPGPLWVGRTSRSWLLILQKTPQWSAGRWSLLLFLTFQSYNASQQKPDSKRTKHEILWRKSLNDTKVNEKNCKVLNRNIILSAFCRFNNETNTEGYVDTNGIGHCISPLLYQTGWVSVEVSLDNGATFTKDGAWLSGRTPLSSLHTLQKISPLRKVILACLSIFPAVHTGKLDAKFKATLVNSTRWQYYGTPGVNGSLDMTWDRNMVNAERVNLELWGYAETGERVFTPTLEISKDDILTFCQMVF